MKIKIKPSFWLVLCLIFYFNLQFPAIALVSSLLHEAGHLTAILLNEGEIKYLQLSAFGAMFDANLSKLSRGSKIAVYLSGPLVSILAALLCFYFSGRSFLVLVFSAGVINLVLGIINLLPMRPLDGGNALWVLAANSRYFKIWEIGFRILFAAVFLWAAVCLKSVFVLLFLFYILFVWRI